MRIARHASRIARVAEVMLDSDTRNVRVLILEDLVLFATAMALEIAVMP